MKTLVGLLKGRIAVVDADSGPGSVFEVTLPGRQMDVPEPESREVRSRVSELALSGQEKTP